MGWIRMTKIGQTRAFYDSRKDELTQEQSKYIGELESMRNRETNPVVRMRVDQLIAAAFGRFEQERLEKHLAEFPE